MIRTPSIWRWQLIFTGSIVAIAVMVMALKPSTFTAPLVIVGFALVVTVTLATLVIPWDRVPQPAVVALPMLDALAIGFTTNAPDIRLGFLWVFPVTWVATYFTMQWVFIAVGFISVCLVIFDSHGGELAETILRVLVVVVTLGFLGTTVSIGMQRSRAARRLLQRQSGQVNRAAQRAETHEERVTQIIDSLDTALVAVTADGAIVRMNDAYRALYGRDRFGATLPASAVEYDDRRGEPLPPDRTPLARAARGEKLNAERVWLYDSEHQWRALHVSTSALASQDGQNIALVIIDDVTDALDAAEERRAVAAIVSHELRNPLTAIIGHIDLMRERDDLPPEVGEQLDIIANAGERMERLVATGLEEARPQQAVLSEPVDLRQIADASAASYCPIATSQSQDLTVTGADTLLIYGDAFRLRQVVDNLLSNAVKYTPAGGVVAVRLGVSDDGRAEVAIEDDGIGMTQDDLARLFEPYFRSDEAKHSGISGTGLGMGIVHDIVEAHAGTIEVDSASGEGTRISMRFPRRPIRKEQS